MKKAMEAVRIFNEEREWGEFHTPENLAKSLIIEAAELLECFQWSQNPDNWQDVEEELADVFTYGIQMCLTLRLDPEEIVLKKLEKTKVKYPVDLAKGKADKYTAYLDAKEEYGSRKEQDK